MNRKIGNHFKGGDIMGPAIKAIQDIYDSCQLSAKTNEILMNVLPIDIIMSAINALKK